MITTQSERWSYQLNCLPAGIRKQELDVKAQQRRRNRRFCLGHFFLIRLIDTISSQEPVLAAVIEVINSLFDLANFCLAIHFHGDGYRAGDQRTGFKVNEAHADTMMLSASRHVVWFWRAIDFQFVLEWQKLRAPRPYMGKTDKNLNFFSPGGVWLGFEIPRGRD